MFDWATYDNVVLLLLNIYIFRYDEELAQSDLLNLPDTKARSGTGMTAFRGKDGKRPAATWK